MVGEDPPASDLEPVNRPEKGKERIVKCPCGQEFGDYRVNLKLDALICVRDTEEKLREV